MEVELSSLNIGDFFIFDNEKYIIIERNTEKNETVLCLCFDEIPYEERPICYLDISVKVIPIKVKF